MTAPDPHSRSVTPEPSPDGAAHPPSPAPADISASQLAGILSIAADAIISMDERHVITMFNGGAENIFGYTAAEVIGQPLIVLLPQEHRAAHDDHVRAFAASGVRARRMGERQEILGRRKNGEVFPAEASISQLVIGQRRIFTAVLRDVTERRRSQAILEQKVEESTRELRAEMRRREESQAQLVRTQRMEAFGQLTGGIAHDFNNLLTVIVGNLELLEMRLEDEKALALLQRAKDAAGMGARLTSRLLTFARRRRYEAVPLDLNDLIIAMAELLERTLGEHVHLTTSLERAPRPIYADASEVENAILNLALNARDAMPSGGKLIIETLNVTFDEDRDDSEFKIQAGDYVRVSVSDTGTGMSADVIRHAFEPFFTTKEPGKGTGLGLSSIYGFVQQAKGAASIYSEIGKGTTISLYLPCHGERAAHDRTAATDDDMPRAAGECILLVEDNADVRAVTVGQLEALGYEVVAVAGGAEARAALTPSHGFDLVFSDVVMAGGINGFELAAWIGEQHPRLPVLLASGYPDGVIEAGTGRRRSPPLLRKPYSRAELASRLRATLQNI